MKSIFAYCFTVLLLIAVLVGYLSVFSVGENDIVVVFQPGEAPTRVYDKPGYYFKIPLVQRLAFFHKGFFKRHIKTEIRTKDGHLLKLNSVLQYKISDPVEYIKFRDNAYLLIDESVSKTQRFIFEKHSLSDIAPRLLSPETKDQEFINQLVQYKIEKELAVDLQAIGLKVITIKVKAGTT